MKQQFNLILTDGGAGDLICQLVAVNFNIQTHQHMHFQIWLPDYLVDLAKHLLPIECTIRPFSKAKTKFRQDIGGLSTQWNMNHTPMRTHPIDYGFHMLCDRHIYKLERKNYLQVRPEEIKHRFDLPEKYICIVATAAEPVKAMPTDTLNSISRFVYDHGYTPVYLGKEESHCGFSDFKVTSRIIEADFSLGINLINKTNLLEAAKVISDSKVIIGMDGGLIHLAGCTDTNIIAGYTLVDPLHVAPIRNGSQSYKFHAIEPDDETPNRYYQTYHSGFQKGDFRKFLHWEESVKSMTADKFIEKLKPIL